MARQCMVTGKKTIVGNNVSHSNRKGKRTFEANVHWKRIWVPSENRYVRLRLSGKGLKTIDKRGIDQVLAQLRANGTV